MLVHDAQLTADQLPQEAAFGHAAMEYAVALGRSAGAGTVVLFHHSPRRTDEELDAIGATYRCDTPTVLVATEGAVIDC